MPDVTCSFAQTAARCACYLHQNSGCESCVGLGTETQYQHDTGTYGTGMYRIRTQISVPHFGAMPERSVDIFVLCFSETDIRSIIITPHVKNYSQTEKMDMNSIRKALIIQIQQIFIVTRVCGFHIQT